MVIRIIEDACTWYGDQTVDAYSYGEDEFGQITREAYSVDFLACVLAGGPCDAYVNPRKLVRVDSVDLAFNASSFWSDPAAVEREAQEVRRDFALNPLGEMSLAEAYQLAKDIARENPVCGNNDKEYGEKCDGDDLGQCKDGCTVRCTCKVDIDAF